MKLVIDYEQTDGYTYSCRCTLPVEYVSQADLMVDFEEAIRVAYQDENWELQFAGHRFNVMAFFYREAGHLKYCSPEILTIDEWFAQYAIT